MERERVDTQSVDNGFQVQHPRIEGEVLHVAVRKPRTPRVELHDAPVRRQLIKEFASLLQFQLAVSEGNAWRPHHPRAPAGGPEGDPYTVLGRRILHPQFHAASISYSARIGRLPERAAAS